MDTALAIAIILVTVVNVTGIFVGWRYVRDWAELLLRPRVFIHRGNAAPYVPQGTITGRFAREPFPLSAADEAALSGPGEDRLFINGRDMSPFFGGGKEWAAGLRAAAAMPIPLGGLSWTSFAQTRGDQIHRQAQFERDLRARDQFATLLSLAPAEPILGTFYPTAAPMEKNRMTAKGNTYYILKTARTPLVPQGRFVEMLGNRFRVIPNIGRPEVIVAEHAAKFETIGAVLAAIDSGVGLSEQQIAGLRICKVTESVTEPMRTVEPVTMSAAKNAKLVVRLAKPGAYQLFRQGNGQRYGDLATAQVFDGLADLQRKAPQTFRNDEREVLALVEQPGQTTFTEVEVG